MATATATVVAMESVQSLAEKQCFLPSFIRPESERPSITDDEQNLPLIDLRASREELIDSIGRASAEWGFFQVIGHGVDQQLMDAVRGAGLRFFERPLEEKLKFACPQGEMAGEGYAFKMLTKEDQVLDWRDYLNHHALPMSRRNTAKWPHQAPYEGVIENYSTKMLELAKQLLALISESLGLKSTYIEEAIGEPYQNIVMNYYPPCPRPDLTLGLQSHSDFGAITLLMEDDVGGLQVRKARKWCSVKPIPGAFVANLGDQVEILSNGRYRSVEHRVVVNSSRPRLAVATFYDPSKNRRISPAPKLIDPQHPQLYRAVLFGDHVSDFYVKGPEGKRNLDSTLIKSRAS